MFERLLSMTRIGRRFEKTERKVDSLVSDVEEIKSKIEPLQRLLVTMQYLESSQDKQ